MDSQWMTAFTSRDEPISQNKTENPKGWCRKGASSFNYGHLLRVKRWEGRSTDTRCYSPIGRLLVECWSTTCLWRLGGAEGAKKFEVVCYSSVCRFACMGWDGVGCMYGWMEGWKTGRMEDWKDGRTDGRMDEWMDGWMNCILKYFSTYIIHLWRVLYMGEV